LWPNLWQTYKTDFLNTRQKR